MYTTPFTTTGAAANEPEPDTPVAAVPVSLNVHASFSDATFDDEIRDPTASRVLVRSPFGYAHDPAGGAAPANVLDVGAGCAEDAEELHPAASPPVKLATVSATGAILRYLATRCLIKTTFYSFDFTAGKPLIRPRSAASLI
jgi:hypothetical protein